MVLLTPLDRRGLGPADAVRDLPRPRLTGEGPVGVVADILGAVRLEGDAAVRRLTERFDRCHVDNLEIDPLAVRAALGAIEPSLRDALEVAADAIEAFHRTQRHAAGDTCTMGSASRASRFLSSARGATCPEAQRRSRRRRS
jgi:histidinol dehydrogenase